MTSILWGKRGRWQFWLAGVGLVAGLWLLLLACQVYLDVRQALDARASQQTDFLIINKDVSIFNTFGLTSSGFLPAEVEAMNKQPFVQQVGAFTAAQFQASTEGTKDLPFYTQLFFESVPDAFLDNRPPDFTWEEGDTRLPVIVSQEFLNLYNFGFAPSQGLPQLSRNTLGLVKLRVTIRGPRGDGVYLAQIVGFSDRIASVLVPDKFMRWANAHLGDNQPRPPSRLIVQVRDATDPAIAAYLTKRDYQTRRSQLATSQAGNAVQTVVSLVGAVGVAFALLSVVLLTTNFRALIAEAREEIALLLQLGYRARTLARHLLSYCAALLGVALVVALVATWASVRWLHAFAGGQGLTLGDGTRPATWLVGVGFVALCFALNALTVNRLLRQV